MKYLFLAMMLSACGAELEKDLVTATTPQPEGGSTLLDPDSGLSSLQGRYVDSEGNEVRLSDDGGLPSIVVFSQEFCAVCVEENEIFRDSLKDSTAAPTKVKMHTILVSADSAIAKDWKDLYSLPWSVGADENLDLFRGYCGRAKTPCLLVHTPQEGIELLREGRVSVSEIKAITGEWQ